MLGMEQKISEVFEAFSRLESDVDLTTAVVQTYGIRFVDEFVGKVIFADKLENRLFEIRVGNDRFAADPLPVHMDCFDLAIPVDLNF